MKIAMVSEHASPLASPGKVDAGGQNVHVASLAQSLAARGHDVTVYTRRDDPDIPTRVTFGPGVEVVHVSAGPPTQIPKDDLYPLMDEFGKFLASEWKKSPPDVVHSHFWMSGLAALTAVNHLPSGVASPPLVHTYHALGSVKRQYQGEDDTSPKARAFAEPMIGNRSDAVIATCPNEVEELHNMGVNHSRIEVVPCGVNVEMFDPFGPAETRTHTYRIMTLGRLVPRKGVDTVIQALGLLDRSGLQNIELEVVGSDGTASGTNSEVQRLTQLAEHEGVADRVHFRGDKQRHEIPPLLRSADAVVCTPWYEPFGIVPLEAMACFTPLVVAQVGGLQDTVVDGVTGIHVPPNDPSSLAQALERLLPNTDLKRTLGFAGRLRVEELYTWERVAQQTERVYIDVLAARLSPNRRFTEPLQEVIL